MEKNLNIITRMIRLDINQKQLAERVGITRPNLNVIINKGVKPQIETAIKISEALGTTVNELWGK